MNALRYDLVSACFSAHSRYRALSRRRVLNRRRVLTRWRMLRLRIADIRRSRFCSSAVISSGSRARPFFVFPVLSWRRTSAKARLALLVGPGILRTMAGAFQLPVQWPVQWPAKATRSFVFRSENTCRTRISVQKPMMQRHFMAKTQCKGHGPCPSTYFLIKNYVLSCLRSGRRAIADSTIAITMMIGPCLPETTHNVEYFQEPWKM